MMTILEKAKANLLIEHNNDDEFIGELIAAATNYAERKQHKEDGYYLEHNMTATTEHAVLMLVAFLYESRDGSTGGFWGDNVQAPSSAFTTIDRLLVLDKDVWSI
jgi:hypothetical protein